MNRFWTGFHIFCGVFAAFMATACVGIIINDQQRKNKEQAKAITEAIRRTNFARMSDGPASRRRPWPDEDAE